MDSSNDWQEVPLNKATGVPPKPPQSRDGVGGSLQSRAADAPVTQDQLSKDPSAGQALLEFLTRGLKAPPDPRNPNFDQQSEQFSKDVVGGIQAGLPIVGLGKGLSAAAKATGISKIPGFLMEKAIGPVKNAMPGLGQSLVDQGVAGTRGMMAKQIASKLPEVEQQVQSAVASLKGEIPSSPISDAIKQRGSMYLPPDGVPIPSGNRPFVNIAEQRAGEALNRGSLSPQQALDTSRVIAKPAYSFDRPLQAFKHQLSQTEAGSLKESLKQLGEKQGVPEVRSSLANERALIQGGQALDKPTNLFDKLSMLLKYGTGLGVGAASDRSNPIAGGAAGALLVSPVGLSLAAKVLSGAGTATKASLDPLMQLLRLRLQNKEVNVPQSNTTNTADDWQEVK